MAKGALLKRNKVTACKQKCPVCKERGLGAAFHVSEVEHQCSRHFWFVGDLKNVLFRELMRVVRNKVFGEAQFKCTGIDNDIAL